MILPVLDDNPRRSIPIAAAVFLLLHLLASILGLLGLGEGLSALGYGFSEAGGGLLTRWEGVGLIGAFAISLFVLLQLCFLWVLADNVEDRLGTPLFVVAYLAIGGIGWLAAGGAAAKAAGGFPQATTAAMLAAYTVLFPKQEILFIHFLPRPSLGRRPGDLVSHGLSVTWLTWSIAQIAAVVLLPVPGAPILLGLAAGGAIGLAAQRFTTAPSTPAAFSSPRARARPGVRRAGEVRRRSECVREDGSERSGGRPRQTKPREPTNCGACASARQCSPTPSSTGTAESTERSRPRLQRDELPSRR